MSNINIRTVWALNEDEEPNMVEAWDEMDVDGNPDGWNDLVKKSALAHGQIRVVSVRIPYDPILKLFFPDPIKGEVEP